MAKVGRLPRIPKSMLRPPSGYKKADPRKFKEDMQALGEEIADEFKEFVIENMESNKYGFSLTPSTVRKKGDDTPFIESGELKDSIVREGTSVTVEDSTRQDGRLTNLQLAIILEYGTKDRHIPPRPLWRMSFRDFRPIAHKKVSKFLKERKLRDNET